MRCAVLFLVLSIALLSVKATPLSPSDRVGQVILARRDPNDPADVEDEKTDPIDWARIAIARFFSFLQYKLGRNPPAAPATAATGAPAAVPPFEISTVAKSGALTVPKKDDKTNASGTVPKKDAQAVPKDQLLAGSGQPIYGQGSPPDTPGGTITISDDEAATLEQEKGVSYPYFQKCNPLPKPVRCSDANKVGLLRCRTLSDVPQGSRCVGPYIIVGYIASGSFGSVYLAHIGDKFFALKLERTDLSAYQEPFNPDEYNIPKELVKAGVKGVVEVFDIFTPLKINGYSMEAAPTNLKSLLKTMTPQRAKPIMIKLATALAGIHKTGVTIRDIKPDNILMFANDEPKFTDFGLAKTKDEPYTMNPGHRKFLAPEVLLTGKAVTNYKPVDVFALGMTFYAMYAKKFSAGWHDLVTPHDNKLIPDGAKWMELNQKDSYFAGIIVAMLHPEVAKRPTAEKVAEVLAKWNPK